MLRFIPFLFLLHNRMFYFMHFEQVTVYSDTEGDVTLLCKKVAKYFSLNSNDNKQRFVGVSSFWCSGHFICTLEKTCFCYHYLLLCVHNYTAVTHGISNKSVFAVCAYFLTLQLLFIYINVQFSPLFYFVMYILLSVHKKSVFLTLKENAKLFCIGKNMHALICHGFSHN